MSTTTVSTILVNKLLICIASILPASHCLRNRETQFETLSVTKDIEGMFWNKDYTFDVFVRQLCYTDQLLSVSMLYEGLAGHSAFFIL